MHSFNHFILLRNVQMTFGRSLQEAEEWVNKGFLVNIERLSMDNWNFRKVLFTTKLSQLAVMYLKPGEDIGEETHADSDQFIRFEEGRGIVRLDGEDSAFKSGISVTIPAGTKHNIIAGDSDSVKLYTIYTPPHHRDGVVHKTKAEAEADTTDEFDGQTTLAENYEVLKVGQILHCQKIRTEPPFDWRITNMTKTRIHMVPIEGGPENQLGWEAIQRSLFDGDITVT